MNKPEELTQLFKTVQGETTTTHDVSDTASVSSTPIPKRNMRETKTINYKDLATGGFDLEAMNTTVPTNFSEAMCTDELKWRGATDKEMMAMNENEVYTLVPKPKGKNIVSCRWVFSEKTDEQGRDTAKARLVARGFTQRYGVDYFVTYSPVAYISLIRFLFATAAHKGLQTAQFNIRTAFFYERLEEDIYMHQPEGYNDETGRV